MAVSSCAAFDSAHGDQVHDCQLDYYGKRLATCSSDRVIKIFEVGAGDSHTHLADLQGHEGPVWQVCWGHPKFGALLASCSFDRSVIVWKESSENAWSRVYTSPPALHSASINAIEWAPHEIGLALACASSDGTLSVITHGADGTWSEAKLPDAHAVGCTSVSWAPAAPPGALVTGAGAPSGAVKRLASCGCDNLIKVWSYQEATGTWAEDPAPLAGHTDWVRCVAWAPNLGLPKNTLASCGQDGKVLIWTQLEPGGPWNSRVLADYGGTAVWSVSWSTMGNILAVSDANNEVKLWKEGVDGEWSQLASV